MPKITKTLLTLGVAFGAFASLAVGPAMAQDSFPVLDELELSANVALVTDYRFRGVSLSDEDIAIQGGLDVGYQGFYIGTWSSSIEQFNGSEVEVDFYGGWSGEIVGPISLDIGVLGFLFPGGEDTDYVEPYATISTSLYGFDLAFGGNYAPDQDNIGDEDNIYLHGEVDYAIPNTPFSLGGHFGWEDGAFGDDKLDWSVTLGIAYNEWTVSVAYVDTDVSGDLTDATAVVSIGASF